MLPHVAPMCFMSPGQDPTYQDISGKHSYPIRYLTASDAYYNIMACQSNAHLELTSLNLFLKVWDCLFKTLNKGLYMASRALTHVVQHVVGKY